MLYVAVPIKFLSTLKNIANLLKEWKKTLSKGEFCIMFYKKKPDVVAEWLVIMLVPEFKYRPGNPLS